MTIRRRMVVALAAFSALSAIGGGIELVLWPHGNAYVPIDLIAGTPFDSLLIPGLLLAIVVGGTSVAAALLVWRRSAFTIDATLLAGGALTVWIAAELALMGEFHWLHAMYGTLGIVILALGVAESKRSEALRHRWVLFVTLGEALGYMFPAMVGLLTTRAGWSDGHQAMALVVAGCCEGLFLGAAQAHVFDRPFSKLRYALLTAAGAGLVWGSVMTTMLLAQADVGTAAMFAAGLGAGLVGLLAIGGLQWTVLRPHSGLAHRWIGWTALAWTLALPLSFAPGPLVDESTPLAAHVVLWGCGGLLMAYVMALVTWQGRRRVFGESSEGRATRG